MSAFRPTDVNERERIIQPVRKGVPKISLKVLGQTKKDGKNQTKIVQLLELERRYFSVT